MARDAERRIGVVTAGMLGLNEAVVATMLGALVATSTINSAAILAALLIVAAVGIELATSRAGQQRRRFIN
ncbi:hypothetical protein [Nocardia brasiliensis]